MPYSTEPRDAQIEQDRAMAAQRADDKAIRMVATVIVIGVAASVVLSAVMAVWVLMGGAK